MADHVIETRDLTVYYGRHRGIKSVSLVVEKGEVFGFLGPNGAGKTTTQRVLLDVIRPTSGHASVFGLDCRKDGVEIRKRIGYLPGELSLYTNMTGNGFLSMIFCQFYTCQFWRDPSRLDHRYCPVVSIKLKLIADMDIVTAADIQGSYLACASENLNRLWRYCHQISNPE